MTTKVSFVRPDQSADECMAMMTARALRHLPVVCTENLNPDVVVMKSAKDCV